jgi:hypothetical protein
MSRFFQVLLLTGAILGLFAGPAPARISETELDKIYNRFDRDILEGTGHHEFGLPEKGNYLDPFMVETYDLPGMQDAYLFRSIYYEFARAWLSHNHLATPDRRARGDVIDAWLNILLPGDDHAPYDPARQPSDEAFAGFASSLKRNVDSNLIDDLRIMRQRLRNLHEDARIVEHQAGIYPPGQGERLLERAARQVATLIAALKSRLERLSDPARTDPGVVRSMEIALLKELDSASNAQNDKIRKEKNLLRSMSRVIGKLIGKDAFAAYEICKDKEMQVENALSRLIGETLSYRADMPEASGGERIWPFVSGNTQWQPYARRLADYDDCVLSLYDSISSNRTQMLQLNGGLGFGASYMREKRRMHGQEQLLLIETLIRVNNMLIHALGWEGDYPKRLWLTGYGHNAELLERIDANKAVLMRLWRERVAGKPPAPAYYAAPVDSRGRSGPGYLTWLLGRWFSNDGITRLAAAGRVIEFAGKPYLVPARYAFRTVKSHERLVRYHAAPLTRVIFR